MTVVVVQCRISSTRLPKKALKDLGGKPVLAWTLSSMRKVKADAYFVATDELSLKELEPVAKNCGWEIFSGPLDDVLKRFCLLIEKTGADIVVRATADNPFLFYEAAQALLDEYINRSSFSKCDYITWTGLPHGSGIEILNAKSLLEAEKFTNLQYDREHVGPALYNHRNKFSALFFKSPSQFYYPEYRTTIDTEIDYRRALAIVKYLSNGKYPIEPYTANEIISSFSIPSVTHQILYIPSVKKGCGTGHLRRCIEAVIESNSFIYIPENADLNGIDNILLQAKEEGLEDWQIIKKLPKKNEYDLIVCDLFSSEKDFIKYLYECAVIIGIDEGSNHHFFYDYLLDIIPSNITRKSNYTETSLMKMPSKIRDCDAGKKNSDINNVLVCFGGEDPAHLSIMCALHLKKIGKNVTAVISDEKDFIEAKKSEINCIKIIPNLRDSLFNYDLVITHYGLTSYEAVYAGCAVLLVATTSLHNILAKKYGFTCIEKKDVTHEKMQIILSEPQKLYVQFKHSENKSLGSFICTLAKSRRYLCPICEKSNPEKDIIISRTKNRTFRRCSSCGIIYMSYSDNFSAIEYSEKYFDLQYKNQYGKTYLEDFTSIKLQGIRRIKKINSLIKKRKDRFEKLSLLDIGCAYGPFLSAGNDFGWQVFGTDVSESAISYVQKKLHFPATTAQFPAFNSIKEFGINQFDVVTMWYVIEHFQNLSRVLYVVSRLVKDGGIFAFSTPSAQGVSAKFNTQYFYDKSPLDHFSIWEPSKANRMLLKFGFKVEKIISTGHHPERFPNVKFDKDEKSILYKLYEYKSRVCKLGDTCEIYCRKVQGK